jgi:hypothetical protein
VLPKISIGPTSSLNVKNPKQPFTKPEPNQSPILVQSPPQFWNHPISPPPDTNLKGSLASFATSKMAGRLHGKPCHPVTIVGSFELLESVPHDANAFTQGFELVPGNPERHFESTGLYDSVASLCVC